MYEHEHESGQPPQHVPPHGFPQYGFPHREYVSGYRGYTLPPTMEEELEILEKWKTKIEKGKAKMDKKLVRIEQRIEELKKEA